ncbi:hypothetical protein UlMin_014921 [Ulmus minor]
MERCNILLKKFSSGSQLADLLLASDLLQRPWNEISKLVNDPNGGSSTGLKYEKIQEGNRMIIAFYTSPSFAGEQLPQGSDLVDSSSNLKAIELFKFLSGKIISNYAFNRAAITLFDQRLDDLSELKNHVLSELEKQKKERTEKIQLIITGSSLGGSIASLFTLWLLESIDFLKDKRPLCITFGSPLIGDSALQKLLSHYSWNSCFLHVVLNHDPVPRFLASQCGYKPFGTFLICSESGAACFEDSKAILELLKIAAKEDPNLGMNVINYGDLAERLKKKSLCRQMTGATTEWATNPFEASIRMQLLSVTQNKPWQNLVAKMEKQERKLRIGKKVFYPSMNLTNMKVCMSYLEWYKKSSWDMEIGYYDFYKNKYNKHNMDVVEFRKSLTNYWKDIVEEAEKKPQKDGVAFKIRWLYAANNYRRMVEPLCIAEYYREDGQKYYKNRGRDKHFILLEKWLNEAEKEARHPTEEELNKKLKKNVASILTLDSCFWAEVEEAIFLCRLLKNEESKAEAWKEKLEEFEKYVMGLLEKYKISSEIFLKHSSFMKWWKDYEEIMGSYYTSPLCIFMRNGRYRNYAEGKGI